MSSGKRLAQVQKPPARNIVTLQMLASHTRPDTTCTSSVLLYTAGVIPLKSLAPRPRQVDPTDPHARAPATFLINFAVFTCILFWRLLLSSPLVGFTALCTFFISHRCAVWRGGVRGKNTASRQAQNIQRRSDAGIWASDWTTEF